MRHYSACGKAKIKKSNEINGVNAETYYNQFVYKVDPTGDYRYHFVQSGWFHVGETPAVAAEQTCAQFSLYLKISKTFSLEYVEFPCNVLGDVRVSRDVARSSGSGEWSEDGTTLVIGSSKSSYGILATGSGIRFNGVETLGLKFTRDLISSGLSTSSIQGRDVSSLAGELVR